MPLLRHDKALHATLYAPLGALSLLAIQRVGRGLKLAVVAGVLAGLYGVTDELHQRFVPGRAADVYDVVADLIGGTIGALTAYLFTHLCRSTTADH